MFEHTKLSYQAYKHLPPGVTRQFPKQFLLYMLLRSRYERLSVHDGKYVISSDFPPYPSPAFNRMLSAIESVRTPPVLPFYASVSLTNRCPYDCWHCYLHSLHEDDMTTQDTVNTLLQLQALGVPEIAFTGGEPLLRDDLEIILKGIQNNQSSIVMFTTGAGLTIERAAALKNAGLFATIIGLEHSNERRQDQLRNHPGAYQQALKGLANAKQAGLYTGLSTVVTKDRLQSGEIWDFITLAGDQNADEVLLLEPVPVRKSLDDEKTILTPDERNQVIAFQKVANKNHRLPRVLSYPYRESCEVLGCCGGYQYLHISASGNVCPCSFTPLSFGNVHQEPLPVLWRRMQDSIRKPRTSCLTLQQYHQYKHFLDNGFIDPAHSNKFCRQTHGDKLPLFYKKLDLTK